jgi:phosphoribosylanthranilate isomerase
MRKHSPLSLSKKLADSPNGEDRMVRTRIKVCGITSPEAAAAAVEAGADVLGFVFVAGTPRHIEPEAAFAIMATLPPMVGTVGVFRDTTLDDFIKIEQRCPTDWSQIHGNEPEELVRDCGPRVIRGIRFSPDTIAAELARWDAIDEVEAILVDGSAGGEGEAFDWAALKNPMRTIKTPVILAGGLNAGNVGDAIRACQPFAVDVSSGVESEPGVKDLRKIRSFCAAVREADATR